jgi:hypothetical protein
MENTSWTLTITVITWTNSLAIDRQIAFFKFIENSIEAGILLGGNSVLHTYMDQYISAEPFSTA